MIMYSLSISAPFCREGEIRLVGGSLDTEGTVELCSNEVWGSICDDLWDNRDATVVCRQLGLSTEGMHCYFNSTYLVVFT